MRDLVGNEETAACRGAASGSPAHGLRSTCGVTSPTARATRSAVASAVITGTHRRGGRPMTAAAGRAYLRMNRRGGVAPWARTSGEQPTLFNRLGPRIPRTPQGDQRVCRGGTRRRQPVETDTLAALIGGRGPLCLGRGLRQRAVDVDDGERSVQPGGQPSAPGGRPDGSDAGKRFGRQRRQGVPHGRARGPRTTQIGLVAAGRQTAHGCRALGNRGRHQGVALGSNRGRPESGIDR